MRRGIPSGATTMMLRWFMEESRARAGTSKASFSVPVTARTRTAIPERSFRSGLGIWPMKLTVPVERLTSLSTETTFPFFSKTEPSSRISSKSGMSPMRPVFTFTVPSIRRLRTCFPVTEKSTRMGSMEDMVVSGEPLAEISSPTLAVALEASPRNGARTLVRSRLIRAFSREASACLMPASACSRAACISLRFCCASVRFLTEIAPVLISLS